MNEVSNEAIMGVLLDIKGDIGELKGHVTSTQSALAAHVIDDQRLGEAVQRLQITQAKQRGFVAALSTVGAVLGAGLGAAVDYFSRGGHH
jgi:hypothetical protein